MQREKKVDGRNQPHAIPRRPFHHKSALDGRESPDLPDYFCVANNSEPEETAKANARKTKPTVTDSYCADVSGKIKTFPRISMQRGKRSMAAISPMLFPAVLSDIRSVIRLGSGSRQATDALPSTTDMLSFLGGRRRIRQGIKALPNKRTRPETSF